MGVIWNKKIEKKRIVYTRTRKKRILCSVLVLIGLFILILLPAILILTVNRVGSWFLYFWAIGSIAPILFVVIFHSYVNFLLGWYKINGKKFQVTSYSEAGDKIIIQR